MTPKPRDIAERVTGLEVSVDGLHSDLIDFKKSLSDTLHELQQQVASAQKTNWSVILTGIMVVIALYAAAVRPVESNVARLDDRAKTLADAVLDQNKILSQLQISVAVQEQRVGLLAPSITQRLAILEYRVGLERKVP